MDQVSGEGRPNAAARCLLVTCHPLRDSLCHRLAARVEAGLAGHPVAVERLDLYRCQFEAPLTAEERLDYFAGASVEDGPLAAHVAALRAAEILVLVFPTWWFGAPALLKGWLDRVWAPGVAFDHPAVPGGRITPRLAALRHCLVVTTLGSPWWFGKLVMRDPLRRTLKSGVLGACAPNARFRMLSLHGAMALAPARLERFEARIDRAVAEIARAAGRGP